MHSENFSDHEMRILNPKTSFAGNVRKRNEALYYNIIGNDSKVNSALSHNLKGEVSRRRQEENEEGKRTSTIVRTGKIANASQSSEYHSM